MKVVALSDLHGYLPAEVPACDLLLLAGDLCPITDHDHFFQAQWLRNEFRDWLAQRQARLIVGIAGNHDLVFEREPELVPRDLPWTYLQDSGVVWEGWRIWGTPWQTWFYDWAFNGDPPRLKKQWALIPPDTDILVVHGPPHGYGDGIPQRNGDVISTGCPHLLERLKEVAPRLVVFGHIHEGRGDWQIGSSTLANVTVLDANYEPAHQPWSIELVESDRKGSRL